MKVEDRLFAKAVLILIHTGVRINELLKLKPSDMHLNERYAIGGSKTDAGKERIIPISEKIYPLVEEIYDENSPYFLTFKKGKKVSYHKFYETWNEFMKEYPKRTDCLPNIIQYKGHNVSHLFYCRREIKIDRVGNLKGLVEEIDHTEGEG